VRTDTWLHEMGQGQYEINLLHGDPVAVADQAFLFKYAAKEVALKPRPERRVHGQTHGGPGGQLHAPAPERGGFGSGHNIFSNAPDGSASGLWALHWRLQTYLPDLMLLYAPFVNSYRRYVAGTPGAR
jgi:glutamine synthetase